MSTITEETSFTRARTAGPPRIRHHAASRRILLRVWAAFRRWGERHAQRRALAELEGMPHLLDDIGLTQAQAQREAAKPFWQR